MCITLRKEQAYENNFSPLDIININAIVLLPKLPNTYGHMCSIITLTGALKGAKHPLVPLLLLK